MIDAHKNQPTMTPSGSRRGNPHYKPVSFAELIAKIDREDLFRTTFTATCAIILLTGFTWPTPKLPLIAAAGLLVGIWPILKEALEDIKSLRMTMELSMLIAICAAAAIGEWVTSLVITAFVLAAEILEDLTIDRGKDALTDLMAFLPDMVHVKQDNLIQLVELQNITVGQNVVVTPGGRIPVDGLVVDGVSTVDESRITGEPLPVEVAPGSTVFAGSINQMGALEITAQRVGKDSSYGRIIEAVKQAQASQAPVQRLADRLAAYLVYFALAAAAITYLITKDITSTISVIVVAGACGIAAGTPLAMLASIARVARSGAFIKDGEHLEMLSQINTIAFDKTGTLTEGEPHVSDIILAGQEAEELPVVAPEELLMLTAAAEQMSEHPLGIAIKEHAIQQGLSLPEIDDFTYEPGKGVAAIVQGKRVVAGNKGWIDAHTEKPAEIMLPQMPVTPVFVAVENTFAGVILLRDQVRAEAKEQIHNLQASGYNVLMITGDNEQTSQFVAAELGIPAANVYAGLLPHQKLDVIDAKMAKGIRLAMVGDGVNDAPALAKANVGIAIGSGTEIARDSADVVLISSHLTDLVTTLEVAKRARRIVMFNFIGTIGIDVLGMALAAFGLLSPIVAALIHVGSETGFILNSARLIPRRME